MNLARRRMAAAGAAALLFAPALARAQSGDQAQVAAAVEALTKAMIAVDRPKLEALTSPALSYGHSAGRDREQGAVHRQSRKPRQRLPQDQADRADHRHQLG
ncbi:hypothetical protein [Dankookia sp. P2]|uniref:hypothetical protein n=1 Tax=Dankookia sp. P2 TaxID=3423955 RepID=UPI003D67984C